MSGKPKKSHVWEQAAHGWYVEPEQVTYDLLEVERFPEGLWDPCVGGGNTVRAMWDSGYTETFGTDVVDRDPGATILDGLHDFLKDDPAPWIARGVRSVIMNPPYFRARGTEAFLRRALAMPLEKVAIFTEIRFLMAGGRARGLWKDHPPTRVWLVADRPSCPPGEYLAAGNEARGGTADWCWIVYDRTAPQAVTELRWLALPPMPGLVLDAVDDGLGGLPDEQEDLGGRALVEEADVDGGEEPVLGSGGADLETPVEVEPDLDLAVAGTHGGDLLWDDVGQPFEDF